MTSRKLYILAICLLLLNTQIDWGDASFLDYIWPERKINYYSADVQSIPSVPFELAEENDKFILDTAKVLGNKISELDFCQQRVILQLKNSCKSLNEEQIGKLAVALMNCQSQTENREVYECSEKMSLGDCTSSMSPEAWNTYNQFLSRTKAMCLTIRQDQFRAVAEMTVNKLLESTGHHFQMMEELKASQKQLEQATLGSIDEMTENNLKLLEKQQELLRLAETQRVNTETNLREIMKEKNLIKSGQAEITTFITNMKNKIDEGLSEIEDHSSNIKEIYDNLIFDLTSLHERAQKISDRLDEASDSILEQGRKAKSHIEETILQLKEVNDIVQELSTTLIDLRRDFDQRVEWLSKYFGGNGIFLKTFPVIVLHVSYLLIGMICLVFINADPLSRLMFLIILSLNLAAVLYEFIEMDLALLTETILAMLLANILAKLSRKVNWQKVLSVSDASKASFSAQNGFPSRVNLNRREGTPMPRAESTILNGYSETNLRSRRMLSDVRPTTPRQSSESNENDRFSDRSRSTTPFDTTMPVTGNRCKALTARGTQCQLTIASIHTEFCRIHERSSIER